MSSDNATNAGEPTPVPHPYGTEVAPTWMPPVPYELPKFAEGIPLHACLGLNMCKGLDRFGSAGPEDGPSAGKANECAGQGYCSTTAKHTCHVQNDCKNQGGCGLYGTAEELDQPGINDCASLGSCATPINAERFSTNGPNQGYSVWARARAVFEERWEKLRADAMASAKEKGLDLDVSKTFSPAPEPFAKIGPPYLWISDNNSERGNMTACGSSGMSGAGGCS